MQLTGSIVVLAASLPHAKVRRTICSLDVEHKVLDETHFICREDYLQHVTNTTHSLSHTT